MILTYVWLLFIGVSFLIVLIKTFFFGEYGLVSEVIDAIFSQAKIAVEISIGIIGLMSFWLGLMRVAEKAGIIKTLSKWVSPLFKVLFPSIPKNHPVYGSIMMNFSANMMGLDNAATPLGLKAMKELQELNPNKSVASNAQIMFLVLNASSLTLLPISVFAYRQMAGSQTPTDVFLPILLATLCSTLAGLFSVAFLQKINLFKKSFIVPMGVLMLVIALFFLFISTLAQNKVQIILNHAGNFLLLSVIVFISFKAFFKKVNIFQSFIEGAKEGLGVAIKIIPYLVGILVLVGVFRAAGGLDMLDSFFEKIFAFFGMDTEFVKALPVAFMKPLSGSGARGLMIDTMNQFGADSFPAKIAATIQGSTETTFYVLAVYYGSVAVKKVRYTLHCALFAELVGVIASIILAYLFFGS